MHIFDTGRVEQTMSLDATQQRPYTAADRPEYGEVGHGPWLPRAALPEGPDRAPLDLQERHRPRPDRGQLMAATRNTVTTVAAIKLGIFIAGLGARHRHAGRDHGLTSRFGSQTEYKAIFTIASLLKKGDDVRVAGVTVGEVKDVEIKNRQRRAR